MNDSTPIFRIFGTWPLVLLCFVMSACVPSTDRFSVSGDPDADTPDANVQDANVSDVAQTDSAQDVGADANTTEQRNTHPSCQVPVTCTGGCPAPHLLALTERFDNDCPGSFVQYSVAGDSICSCGNIDVQLPNSLKPHRLEPISPSKVLVFSETIASLFDIETAERDWFWARDSRSWFWGAASFRAGSEELIGLSVQVPYYARSRDTGADAGRIELFASGQIFSDPWDRENILFLRGGTGDACRAGCLERFGTGRGGADIEVEDLGQDLFRGSGNLSGMRLYGRHAAASLLRSFATAELPVNPPDDPMPIELFQIRECSDCLVEEAFPDGEGGAYHLCSIDGGQRNEREIYHNCSPLSATGPQGLNWGFTSLALAPQ